MNISKIKMIDAHTHLYDMQNEDAALSEISYRKKAGIFSVYCAKNPVEWEFLKKLGLNGASDEEMLSFGIHPWESGSYKPSECMGLYEQAPIIGEIGLDSVWTQVPLSVQRRVFKEQLDIAASLKKPVILHTKGCEKEIAEMISGFKQPVLVHWYSGEVDALRDFAEMGCFFTIGPDACLKDGKQELLRAMLGLIPRERLLTETDGLESIFWVQEQCKRTGDGTPEQASEKEERNEGDARFSMILDSLKVTAGAVAAYDCVDVKGTEAQLVFTFMEFAGGNSGQDGRCLIIAGGEEGPIPEPAGFSYIIAADRGLQYAETAGVEPDIAIGDFDSVSRETLTRVMDSSGLSTVILPAQKNDSDLQSAIKYALLNGFRDITVCCAMGGRLDHLVANLQAAAHAASRGAVCALTGERDEAYIFTGRTMAFPRREGCSFSVFSLSDRCEGVDITGARYTVKDFSFRNDLCRGLSNEWASDRIEVSVTKGILAVIVSKY